MRTMDGFQATLQAGQVKVEDGQVVLTGNVRLAFPMPKQDGNLPNEMEAAVEDGGQELKRQLYRLTMEKADAELVLQTREGKQGKGVVRRGKKSIELKTIFGTVLVDRQRIQHKADGTTKIPAADVWNTPRQVAITAGLKNATCDAMLQQSANHSLKQIEQRAGEEYLISHSTVLNIVHQEGAQLIRACQERADAVFKEDPDAAESLLPSVREPDPWPEEELPGTGEDADPQEEEIPLGFPGSDVIMEIAANNQPRQVDPGWVIVEADEVKLKAQACTKRKQLLIYTALVMTAHGRWHFSAKTAADLIRQVGGLLAVLEVHRSRKRLLFLADGAQWIRQWFDGLHVSGKAMVLCWYHLYKRCGECLSMACRGREHREKVQLEIAGHLWEGRVREAIEVLESRRDEMKNTKALDQLIGYLQRREGYIPNYQARRKAGLWIASNRIEKFNDWAISTRCKGRGMDWTADGAAALAAMQSASRNGELTMWRQTRQLPSWDVSATLKTAA